VPTYHVIDQRIIGLCKDFQGSWDFKLTPVVGSSKDDDDRSSKTLLPHLILKARRFRADACVADPGSRIGFVAKEGEAHPFGEDRPPGLFNFFDVVFFTWIENFVLRRVISFEGRDGVSKDRKGPIAHRATLTQSRSRRKILFPSECLEDDFTVSLKAVDYFSYPITDRMDNRFHCKISVLVTFMVF
jgi:hypothetical protein